MWLHSEILQTTTWKVSQTSIFRSHKPIWYSELFFVFGFSTHFLFLFFLRTYCSTWVPLPLSPSFSLLSVMNGRWTLGRKGSFTVYGNTRTRRGSDLEGCKHWQRVGVRSMTLHLYSLSLSLAFSISVYTSFFHVRLPLLAPPPFHCSPSCLVFLERSLALFPCHLSSLLGQQQRTGGLQRKHQKRRHTRKAREIERDR